VGMVESHDELIMEIADEIGLNHMGEDAINEEDDEDDDDEGNVVAPPATVVPPSTPVPPAATTEVITVNEEDPMEMVPEQEAPKMHGVILADVEPELPQPRLFNMIMRDYEESPSRVMDDLHDLDDLDDLIEVDYGVDEWFPVNGSNDRD
jgi:hypothetical protein